MTTYHVLVVAQQTAATTDLLNALEQRAARSPVRYQLLMPFPATASRATAQEALEAALQAMRARGLEVDGEVGFGQPLEVVFEAWDPRRWDEIIVSTLPAPLSTWMRVDLPHRIERMTGVQVTHVVATPHRDVPVGGPPPAHTGPGVLAPLKVLGWGHAHH
jgi:hypothetical protein